VVGVGGGGVAQRGEVGLVRLSSAVMVRGWPWKSGLARCQKVLPDPPAGLLGSAGWSLGATAV
jgi:hypothetical protein